MGDIRSGERGEGVLVGEFREKKMTTCKIPSQNKSIYKGKGSKIEGRLGNVTLWTKQLNSVIQLNDVEKPRYVHPKMAKFE